MELFWSLRVALRLQIAIKFSALALDSLELNFLNRRWQMADAEILIYLVILRFFSFFIVA